MGAALCLDALCKGGQPQGTVEVTEAAGPGVRADRDPSLTTLEQQEAAGKHLPADHVDEDEDRVIQVVTVGAAHTPNAFGPQWPQEPVKRFQVRLEKKAAADRLGLDLRHCEGYLAVSQVYSGFLVDKHNSDHSITLEKGDIIVKVNGVEGDAEKMAMECQDSLEVIFHVIRK
mmetsp:Transcript_47281/g.86831  ORF Transcript_47281/g.86831 Transcript_47281/m.86831 type:complete len:173 (-) Transcript_47281:67-585(-)